VNIWQHKRMPKNAHGTFTVVILLLSTTNYKHCKRIVGGKHTVIWSKAILKTKKTLQRFLLQILARASVIPEETDGETKHKYARVCVCFKINILVEVQYFWSLPQCSQSAVDSRNQSCDVYTSLCPPVKLCWSLCQDLGISARQNNAVTFITNNVDAR